MPVRSYCMIRIRIAQEKHIIIYGIATEKRTVFPRFVSCGFNHHSFAVEETGTLSSFLLIFFGIFSILMSID